MKPWRRLRRLVASLEGEPDDEQLHRIRILAKRAEYLHQAGRWRIVTIQEEPMRPLVGIGVHQIGAALVAVAASTTAGGRAAAIVRQ